VQLPAPGDAFQVTPLRDESFVLLVPKKHPLARRRLPKLAELGKEAFVFYKGRARDVAQAACRAAGFEPRTACESGELETIRSLVAADLGIALLPELAARGSVPASWAGSERPIFSGMRSAIGAVSDLLDLFVLVGKRLVDRVRPLVGETGSDVGTEAFMLGNRNAAALWGGVALIVADQPFDFEGFALHRAALPAAASVDKKMRSISDAGIMAAP
jgi:hypothetical protein